MASRKWTSVELARQIRNEYDRGSTVIELAQRYNMSRQGIYNAIRLANGQVGRKPPRIGLLAWLDE